MALAETMPTGVRMIAGRALPPDVLRNRLSAGSAGGHRRCSLRAWRSPRSRCRPRSSPAMLASEAGQVAHAADAPRAAARHRTIQGNPGADRAHRGAGAGVASAAAERSARRCSTAWNRRIASVCARWRARSRPPWRPATCCVTRSRACSRSVSPRPREESPPVPLPERAAAVCELYAALAQCRFGAGKQGQNAYRAGLMGMLTPQKWAPYPEALIAPAALDVALAAARADSSDRQAFAVRRHGARHRGGWTPDRAAGRSAARRLHAGRLPGAAHSHRRGLRRSRRAGAQAMAPLAAQASAR